MALLSNMLIIGLPGQNQRATQEARFLGGFIFNRLHAEKGVTSLCREQRRADQGFPKTPILFQPRRLSLTSMCRGWR
jgi:hypothetical protein